MFRATTLAAALLFCSTCAFAGIINGDFETGDLTGWGGQENNYSGTTTVSLVDGDYAAVLQVDGQADTSNTAPTAQYLAFLAQSFILETPGTISFDWKGSLESIFTESAGYGGAVSVVITIDGQNTAGLHASGVVLVEQPWTTVTKALNAGPHSIYVTLARDVLEAEVAASIYLDNFHMVTVPEPSSALLLLLGAVTHLGILRSRSASRRLGSK